jgi:hypothetical protein
MDLDQLNKALSGCVLGADMLRRMNQLMSGLASGACGVSITADNAATVITQDMLTGDWASTTPAEVAQILGLFNSIGAAVLATDANGAIVNSWAPLPGGE